MEEDEVVFINNDNFSTQKEAVSTRLPQFSFTSKDSIDNSVWEEIRLILNESLLFEEDMEQIKNVFSHVEVRKDDLMHNMFRGTNAFLVFFLGMILYLYVGAYAFVIVSIFYAYKTSNYLWMKHSRQKQIKRLLTTIKNNFMFLRKVIKFLHEHENILKTRFSSNEATTAKSYLRELKQILMKVQYDINCVYRDATIKLLKEVPLLYDIDLNNSESQYICLYGENHMKAESVSQLHNMHMLLQSQFLTRLVFSLAPCLLKNSDFLPVHKIIIRVVFGLKNSQNKLVAKFKYPMLNGVSFSNDIPCQPLPKKTRKEIVEDKLGKNVHNISSSLQYSLIKSRELEDKLEAKLTVDEEKELIDIQNELQACHLYISNLLMKNKSDNNDKLEEVEPEELSSEKSSGILLELGLPTLDPQVEDDVFEATASTDLDSTQMNNWDEEEYDPLVKRKRGEMLGELKCRIKTQAEDWARREKEVRIRKGLPEPDTDSESEEIVPKKSRKWKCFEDNEDIEEHCAYTGGIPPNPLIAEAFKLNTQGSRFLTEENFCASGENSDED